MARIQKAKAKAKRTPERHNEAPAAALPVPPPPQPDGAPLVSVIITTWGDDPEPAIRGILGQNLTNTQIIVTHGGEGIAAERAAAYAARHPRLVMAVQPERQGLGAALDCALDRATGQYVTFLESHWTLAIGCLEEFSGLLSRQATDLCKYHYTPQDPMLFPLNVDAVSGCLMRRGGAQLPFLGQWRSAFYARALLEAQRACLQEELVWGAELLLHAQAVLACRRPSFCGGGVCYPAGPGQAPDAQRLQPAQVRAALQVLIRLEQLFLKSLPRSDAELQLLAFLQLFEQLENVAGRALDPGDARRCRASLREMLQRCPQREEATRRLGGFHSLMPDAGRGAPPRRMAGTGIRLPHVQIQRPLFRHSGALGDVIYALPALAALTARCGSQGAVLCLNAGPGARLSAGGVRALLPLLQRQPYIHEVRLWQGERPDFDLDAFRGFAVSGRGDIMRWYQYALPVAYDTSQPWLSGVEPDAASAGALVIARALRRQTPGLDYGFLRRYAHVLFIGIEREYAEMQALIPQLVWRQTADFLDMARVIAAARLFIGSQSSPFAVAEALKVPRLLELPLAEPVATPAGARGAVFCVQECFEQLVEDFWGG